MMISFKIMKRILRNILIFNVFVITASALGFGKCPDLSSMKQFDIKKFSGQWFEVERSFYLLELAASCTHMNFTLNQKNVIFDVEILTINRWNKRPVFAYGMAIPNQRNFSTYRYKVNTNLPSAMARFLPGAGIYKILQTDYENYTILWHCSDILFAHNDRIFVLGREREISEKIRIEVYETLKKLNLDPDRLIVSKNANCTFLN